MPDHSLLPDGLTIERIPMPTGGLPQVRVRARRLRFKRVSVSGGLMTGVVLGGLVLGNLAQPSGETLIPLPHATPGPIMDVPVSPLPLPVPSSGRPAESAETIRSVTKNSKLPPPTPREVPGAIAPDLTPHARPAATLHPSRRSDPDAELISVTDSRYVPEACSPTGAPGWPATVNGWCVAGSPRRAPSTNQLYLGLWVCRDSTAGRGQLRWDSSKEVGFAVRDAQGRTVYTYDPQDRPVPIEREVAAGTCLQYVVPWDDTTEDGEPLPTGEYELLAWSTEPSLRSQVDRTPFSRPAAS